MEYQENSQKQTELQSSIPNLTDSLAQEMEQAFEGLQLDTSLFNLDPINPRRKDLLKREGMIKNEQNSMEKLISQQANGPKFNHLSNSPMSNIELSNLMRINCKRDSNYLEEELQISPATAAMRRKLPADLTPLTSPFYHFLINEQLYENIHKSLGQEFVDAIKLVTPVYLQQNVSLNISGIYSWDRNPQPPKTVKHESEIIFISGNLNQVIHFIINTDSAFVFHATSIEVLKTYRYYADPRELVRILILYYFDAFSPYNTNSSNLDKEKSRNSIGSTSKSSSKFSKNPSAQQNLQTSQSEIINFLRKWSTEYKSDFIDLNLKFIFESFLDYLEGTQKGTLPICNYIRNHLKSSSGLSRSDSVNSFNGNSWKSEDALPSASPFSLFKIGSNPLFSPSSQPSSRSTSKNMLNRIPLVQSFKEVSNSTTASLAKASQSGDLNSSNVSTIHSTKKLEAVIVTFETVELTTFIQQVSLIEQELFKRISIKEVIQRRWERVHNDICLAPNVQKYLDWFDHISGATATTMVQEADLQKRVTLLKKFITIAFACSEIGNYNTCFQIVAGLNMDPVSRLKNTWKVLPKKYYDQWIQLNELVSSKKSHASYRATLKQFKEEHRGDIVVPYFGLYLSDIVQVETRNETYMSSSTPTSSTQITLPGHSLSVRHVVMTMPVINLSKFRVISLILQEISEFKKCKKYDFPKEERVQEWLKNEFITVPERELFILSNLCQSPEEVEQKL